MSGIKGFSSAPCRKARAVVRGDEGRHGAGRPPQQRREARCVGGVAAQQHPNRIRTQRTVRQHADHLGRCQGPLRRNWPDEGRPPEAQRMVRGGQVILQAQCRRANGRQRRASGGRIADPTHHGFDQVVQMLRLHPGR